MQKFLRNLLIATATQTLIFSQIDFANSDRLISKNIALNAQNEEFSIAKYVLDNIISKGRKASPDQDGLLREINKIYLDRYRQDMSIDYKASKTTSSSSWCNNNNQYRGELEDQAIGLDFGIIVRICSDIASSSKLLELFKQSNYLGCNIKSEKQIFCVARSGINIFFYDVIIVPGLYIKRALGDIPGTNIEDNKIYLFVCGIRSIDYENIINMTNIPENVTENYDGGKIGN